MEEQLSRAPLFLGYFDVSNVGFAWREPRPEQIERRRAAMGDVLIFDILLTSGGIRQPDTLFPPTGVEDLLRLLNAIEDSNYDTLKKECLVYFLLKWHQDGREERFLLERCLPPQFTALADAYWYLDTGLNIPRAVSILSDARLNRDYASKIIHAISLTPNPAPLIVKYVRTAKPLLVEPVDLDIYTIALAESRFIEAWQFQRTFSEADPTRARLFEKILEWSISPDPRSEPLAALVGFPLSPFEETFLHKYALDPPKYISTSSIGVLRDLICVRLIQLGQYTAAVKIDHQFASSTLNESKTNTQDRRKMIQDLYTALPQVERTLLDSELENLSDNATTVNLPSAPTTSYSNGELSMSQSWEEVPRPSNPQKQINGNIGTSSYRDIVPISERSGAPRFGGPSIPTSTSTPIAPTIPISTSAAPAARTSFPLPSMSLPDSAYSSSSRPRQSFLNTSTSTPLITAGGSLGLPSSKSQPLPASTSATHGFSPATRRENAFYQPPPVKLNGLKRSFDIIETPEPVKDAPNNEGDMDEDIDHDDQAPSNREEYSKRGTPKRDNDRTEEFGFSVFGSAPPAQSQRNLVIDSPPRTRNKKVAAVPKKAARRVLPGAFLSEEEDGEEADQEQDEVWNAPPAPQPSRSRPSRQVKATAPPEGVRDKHLKDADLGRSLPGSLMDNEEEEVDEVGPLRPPSPPRRHLRKARSSTPSDLGDDVGDGVQTRRRSTRLSTTGSAHAASPERPPSPKRTAGKTRKSTRASTGGATTRKKR